MHGRENLPAGPTIFVVNHFTRIETLLPYHIYTLTQQPVWSLADAAMFRGTFGNQYTRASVRGIFKWAV